LRIFAVIGLSQVVTIISCWTFPSQDHYRLLDLSNRKGAKVDLHTISVHLGMVMAARKPEDPLRVTTAACAPDIVMKLILTTD